MKLYFRATLRLLPLALLCSGAARAGTVYTDLTSFLAAIAPGYYLENFNAVDASSAPTSMDFSANGFSYTASAPQGLYAGDQTGGGNPLFGVNSSNDALTFVFTSGNVTAVGGYFFETNISDVIQPGIMTLVFSDGTSTNVSSGSPPPFLGYVSDAPLTSLVISGQSGVWVAMDDFYAGASSVPEPATATLLFAGVLLLATRRRAYAYWRRTTKRATE